MNPRFLLAILLFAHAACTRDAGERTRLVIAATTSIEDTGLLDVLAAEFGRAHPEIELSAVAVGTGQALELGRRGDADVLITHDSVAEMQLIAEGIASERRSLMFNYFVIAGPAGDPAGARGDDPVAALRAIARAQAPFVSRGDDSGTHRRELSLWQQAGLDSDGAGWYMQAGVGMGDALLLAGQKDAYILTDRATYLRFKPRVELVVICEDGPELLNRYAVTVIEGDRKQSAQVFAEWLTGSAAQRLIGEFGRADVGQSLFTPSARPHTDPR